MSSLLQFSGDVSKKGVGLQFIESIPDRKVIGFDRETMSNWYHDSTKYPDKFRCPICGALHPYIWVAYRKPAGMCGCWVIFRINGTTHVPDLSIPITVGPSEHIKHLPIDACKQSGNESARLWHLS